MIAIDNKLLPLIAQHKAGKPVGITSVCSANNFVIKAAILNAKKNNKIVLIESTSNQVDQFGGYTGLTPNNFRKEVLEIAKGVDFPAENILLGGDHLGPNRWQNENSDSAMQKAEDQITAYIEAGYTKIHLDASMKCKDDGNSEEPLNPSVIAERSALLCEASEEAYRKSNNNFDPPVYVIGTDVPTPGGAKSGNSHFHLTKSEEVEETIHLTKKAFEKYNLSDAWERVIAVVVQPGVEFGDEEICEYERKNNLGLINKIEEKDNIVFEAHSTDYQRKENLKRMVEDHYAILKVGPWLTFAFREALFSLSFIEKEYLSNKKNIILSNLIDVIEERMLQNPVYWEKYYNGTEDDKKFKRKYSLSDRIRYYWNDSLVKTALLTLIKNLTENNIPPSLISQFYPEEYYLISDGSLIANPYDIIIRKITSVLENYNYAENGGNS
jgi:D-tagatose-1,6-bisphosphate aldolase subunit GatZ/KbaZ